MSAPCAPDMLMSSSFVMEGSGFPTAIDEAEDFGSSPVSRGGDIG